MTDNTRAMVLASFAADALSLSAHWIYDTNQIDATFGIIDHMLPPGEGSYHPTKSTGEFTHYGDQTLLLLKHLASNNGFALATFAKEWQEFNTTYTGYVDHSTKSTLAALNAGTSPDAGGSSSTDLGGPARIAPLIYWYANNPDLLIKAAQAQTRFTHAGPGVDVATEFIVKLALLVLEGRSPSEAVHQLVDEGVRDIDLDIRLRRCLDSTFINTRDVIAEFGQMCKVSSALPGAVHLILTYQGDLREALIQNVMAGGDSAARGLVIGMILGAHQGMDGIDESWLKDMQATSEINTYLDKRI
ncbi:ADP-ribosylglycohydrolase family protein [Desulfosediminicola flagellatus]|uniref:ADP-ribosylglycohydrolase family protein n=1 Tax=Desulfosediminicola flagellatus TaxID=2569541 RepID=UPI0010AB81F9|nr:ADP-ribosylglycohydrolase family protein [Desulfosediminicola flagellatus]